MQTLAALLADKEAYDSAGGFGGGLFICVVIWLLLSSGGKKGD